MKNEFTIFLTKLLIPLAVLTGAGGELLDQIDLLMGIVLKGLSIISFIIVITINWNKFIRTIKVWISSRKY